MTYLLVKGFLLLFTAPIWVIPWAIARWRQSRRPHVKVIVKEYRR